MWYFSLIYSLTLYALEIYANTYLTYLHEVMILNNRILRILQHKPLTTNIGELYISCNTLPINKLFQFQLLLHAHNILYNINKLSIIFHATRSTNYDIHNHNTRSSHDFHRSSCNSTFGLKVSIYGHFSQIYELNF